MFDYWTDANIAWWAGVVFVVCSLIAGGCWLGMYYVLFIRLPNMLAKIEKERKK